MTSFQRWKNLKDFIESLPDDGIRGEIRKVLKTCVVTNHPDDNDYNYYDERYLVLYYTLARSVIIWKTAGSAANLTELESLLERHLFDHVPEGYSNRSVVVDLNTSKEVTWTLVERVVFDQE